MKHFISTSNLGFKRKLNKNYKVYNFDEFITLLLNYKTNKKYENLYLPYKKNSKKITFSYNVSNEQ